jgi:putative transposase
LTRPPTERFFRSLKHEQLNYEKFKTQEAAKLSIIDYLAFYNGRRTHSKLGYQSPLKFEQEFYRKAS